MKDRDFTGQEWLALARGCVRGCDFNGSRGAQVGIGLPNAGLKAVVRIIVVDRKCTMMLWVWCDRQERVITSGEVASLSDLINPAAIQSSLKHGSDPLPACIEQLEKLVTRVAQNESSWVGLFRSLKISKSNRLYRPRLAPAPSTTPPM